MPHPDYPPGPIPTATPGNWLTPPGPPEQIGTSPNKKWEVRLLWRPPDILQFWWSNTPDHPLQNPHSIKIDTPATRALTRGPAMLTLSSHNIPANPGWHTLVSNPQLAQALRHAIQRLGL